MQALCLVDPVAHAVKQILEPVFAHKVPRDVQNQHQHYGRFKTEHVRFMSQSAWEYGTHVDGDDVDTVRLCAKGPMLLTLRLR